MFTYSIDTQKEVATSFCISMVTVTLTDLWTGPQPSLVPSLPHPSFFRSGGAGKAGNEATLNPHCSYIYLQDSSLYMYI